MLQILGIIFLLIIGKFIYDTFLTNNTAETKEWYKKHYPEENYRLDKNEGLDFNVKPKININDRQRSIEEMAKNMNTTPELAQKKFIERIKTEVNSQNEKITFLKEVREKKIEEAKIKGIDPDDGIASLMEKWAKEYFNSIEFNKEIIEKEKFNYAKKELLDTSPELKKIVDSGNKDEIINYLKKHPEQVDIYFDLVTKITMDGEVDMETWEVKPKTNINDKERSIDEIANYTSLNFNSGGAVTKNNFFLFKKEYIEQLKSKINSHDEKIYFLKTIRKKKIEEAETKGIDPDDCVSALMEELAKEYLNSVDFKTNDKSNLEVSNTYFQKRYKLEEIENLDDMQNIKLLNGELVTGIIYCQFGDLGEFYQGKARGLQRKWWKNGRLKAEEDFGLDGQCFTSKGWHENGNLYLETIGELKAGEFTIKIYHENGNLQMTKSYKNKYEHGISKTYNQEGGIISEIMFQDGLLHGRNTSYYNNGTKKSITHYNEDIAEGEYKHWYENGNLQREGLLKGSCPIGEWKYYNEDGTIKDTKFTSDIENLMQSAQKMPSERKLRKEADDLWNSK